MTTQDIQAAETAKAPEQRIVPTRFQPVDFLAMTGRFFIVGSGEGGYPGEIVKDAGDCHAKLLETLPEDCDDDIGWVIDELRDPDNWNADEGGTPYWCAFDVGEISRIHIIRVADDPA